MDICSAVETINSIAMIVFIFAIVLFLLGLPLWLLWGVVKKQRF